MRLAPRTLGIVVAASAIAFGCNLLTGASDLRFGSDTTASSGGSNDGGSNDGASATTCVAPGGYAGLCIRDREGWSPVVIPGSGASCPPDYASGVDLRGAATGSDRCDCTCQPKTGSCNPLALEYGSGNTCTNGSTLVTFPPDGGCLAALPGQSDKVRLTVPIDSVPSGCGPDVTETFAPIATTKTCSGAKPTASTECDRDSACYPAPPPGSQACIIHDGETECPRGYDRRTVAGTNASDTRACASCTCADDACAGARVQLYFDDKCSLLVGSIGVGQCEDRGAAGLAKGASYKAPSGCRTTKPAGNALSGRVTVEGAKTICCP